MKRPGLCYAGVCLLLAALVHLLLGVWLALEGDPVNAMLPALLAGILDFPVSLTWGWLAWSYPLCLAIGTLQWWVYGLVFGAAYRDGYGHWPGFEPTPEEQPGGDA